MRIKLISTHSSAQEISELFHILFKYLESKLTLTSALPSVWRVSKILCCNKYSKQGPYNLDIKISHKLILPAHIEGIDWIRNWTGSHWICVPQSENLAKTEAV